MNPFPHKYYHEGSPCSLILSNYRGAIYYQLIAENYAVYKVFNIPSKPYSPLYDSYDPNPESFQQDQSLGAIIWTYYSLAEATEHFLKLNVCH